MSQKMVEPPRTIHFHPSHSKNVIVHSTNPTIAIYSLQSQTPAFLFTSRPLKPREKFTLKFLQASTTSKLIKIGFTSWDPSLRNFNENLALDNPKFWACSLVSSLFAESKTLFFYFTEKTINYGIDDEEKGFTPKDLDTKSPLWGIVYFTEAPLTLQVINTSLQPLKLHQRRGRNVKLQGNRMFLADRKTKSGYAFTERPLQIGEWLVLKILKLSESVTGKFTLGVTTCDPGTLQRDELPNNFIELIHKAKHTKIIEMADLKFMQFEEISCHFVGNGSMTIWRDGTLIKRVYLGEAFREKFWGIFELGTAKGIEVCSYLGDCNNYCENVMEKSEVNSSTVCVICYEKAAEVALYPCGHYCMCEKCAKRQWQRFGNGRCPICRAVILDVLRIYY